MAPLAGSSCVSRPRAATRRKPSSSEMAPATQAAAYSPRLCPTRATGSTPHERHRVASAYSMAKVTGWAYAVSLIGDAAPAGAKISSSRPRSRCGLSAASQASSAARNTDERSYSARPMPTYCAPCPVNRKATCGRIAPSVWPVASRSCSRPAMKALKPSTICAAVSPRTARRCEKWVRPALAVKQRSARGTAGADSASTYRRASSANAASVRADRASMCVERSFAGATAAAWGASSRITWALVPLNPKALTPARRFPPIGSQARRSVGTFTGHALQSMRGLPALKCRCGGMSRRCRLSTTLATPARPAAASRWPMLVLTEPMMSGRAASRPGPSTAPNAPTSIGSPRGVPVPCVST